MTRSRLLWFSWSLGLAAGCYIDALISAARRDYGWSLGYLGLFLINAWAVTVWHRRMKVAAQRAAAWAEWSRS